MLGRIRIGLALVIPCLVAGGCGESVSPVSPSDGSEPDLGAQGDVVARVDGHVITHEQVERAMSATGLSRLEALRQLEDEQLLWAEATRRGYGDRRTVRDAARKAAVQAVLDALEHQVSDASISIDDVATEYEAWAHQYRRPELRASKHLLARLPRRGSSEGLPEAERFVRDVLRDLQSAPSPEEAMERYAEHRAEAFSVVIETLPAIHHEGALEPSFKEALFAAEGPGLVTEPVHTSYGVHAIVVTAIEPARITPLEEATPQIRRELLVSARERELSALLGRLRSEVGVELYDAVIAEALSNEVLATADAP